MKFWLAVLIVAAFLVPNLVLAQSGGDLLKQGQEVYENNCADCHRSNGEGLPVKFPALKGNAYVQGDPKPVIGTILNGRKGNLGLMPAWKEHLGDNQIAAAISYIRNAWGNTAPAVKPEDVKKLRASARGFFQEKAAMPSRLTVFGITRPTDVVGPPFRPAPSNGASWLFHVKTLRKK